MQEQVVLKAKGLTIMQLDAAKYKKKAGYRISRIASEKTLWQKRFYRINQQESLHQVTY